LKHVLGAIAFGAALSAAGTLAHAQGAASFYKGKTINLVVGFSAGGGYDSYGRLLARHLGRHIPGQPDVIVQNLPGAGSLNAVRQLEATQSKDGTYITTFNPALIVDSLLYPEKTRFKFADVNWIGSMAPEVRVCVVMASTGIKSWEDMMKRKEVIVGATAKGTAAYVNGAILHNMFGVPIKQVLGFPGGAEQKLAMERGELDGDCGSWSSVDQDWIKQKKIVPIVSFSPTGAADLPKEVPFIGKFVTKKEQQDVLDIFTTAGELGRPFIMAKAVPEDRVAAIRVAFEAALKDKQLLADAEKLSLPIQLLPGSKAADIIERVYKASPDAIEKARQAAE